MACLVFPESVQTALTFWNEWLGVWPTTIPYLPGVSVMVLGPVPTTRFTVTTIPIWSPRITLTRIMPGRRIRLSLFDITHSHWCPMGKDFCRKLHVVVTFPLTLPLKEEYTIYDTRGFIVGPYLGLAQFTRYPIHLQVSMVTLTFKPYKRN